MLMARKSIFLISGMIFLLCFGIVMIYLILFGNTMGSFAKEIFNVKDTDTGLKSWLGEKQIWICALGVVLLPIVIKKELQELHIVSLILFLAILIFIVGVFYQTVRFGNTEFVSDPDQRVTFADVQWPYKGTSLSEIYSSICIIFFAFGLTVNLFPIYSALKVKTNESCNKTISLSILLTGSLYAFLAITALFLFGG